MRYYIVYMHRASGKRHGHGSVFVFLLSTRLRGLEISLVILSSHPMIVPRSPRLCGQFGTPKTESNMVKRGEIL